MKDEDVLFRSIKGISYISISPLILLTASLWFTPDNLAVVLAHLAQLYFSVFLLFLFGNMWSIRANSNELVSKLANLSLLPLLIAIAGGTLTFFVNPIWGISSLLFAVYTSVTDFGDPIETLSLPAWWSTSSLYLCQFFVVQSIFWKFMNFLKTVPGKAKVE